MLKRFIAGIGAVLIALLATVLGAGAVAAQPPLRLPEPVSDLNGALGSDAAEVTAAVDALFAEDKVTLWVVFVDDFSGADAASWAEQTFRQSDLGPTDVLFAVATEDRAVALIADKAFPLSTGQLDEIRTTVGGEQLRGEKWAAGAVAVAESIRDEIGSSGGMSGFVVVLVIMVVAVVVGFLWMRSRSKKKADGEGGTPGQPQKPLEPYDKLSERAVNALISTDNAVQTSQAQLQLAEQTFGADQMKGFRAAFEKARADLAAAFQLRQQIDDDVEESESTRRGWLAEILQRCERANTALDEQSAEFDRLLDAKSRLPQLLAELPGRLDTLQSRIPQAEATLQTLRSRYAASALTTVATNPGEARQRIELARADLATAGSTADQTRAAVAARDAVELLEQGTTLVDAVAALESELTSAAAALPAEIAPVQAELAAARAAFAERSAGSESSPLAARLDQVATALAAAGGPAGQQDPILARQRVHEADEELDDILADTRTAQEKDGKARSALQNALASAQSRIARATDYVGTHRGAVASEARTRLAEANRHLAAAHGLADSDPGKALQEAYQAEKLAEAAIQAASRDIGGFGGGGFGGGGFGGRGGGSNIGGAILGGVIGGILSSGGGRRGGGFSGGFGGGGFGGGGGGGGGFSGGGGRF